MSLFGIGYLGIVVIGSFSELISQYSQELCVGFVITLISLALSIYIFLCMFALFKRFRYEQNVKLGNMHVRMSDDFKA